MAQRMIQLSIRDTDQEELSAYCEPAIIVSVTRDAWRDGLLRVHMVVETGQSEAVMDRLEQLFSSREDFQLTLLPLEATLPRPAEPEPAPAEKKTAASIRISREELYQEITAGLKVRSTFVTMVLLSSIVAAIGLYRDDTAILIGAMVIAPLLGPNVALSLAATLGDSELAWKATRTNALGVCLSLMVALAFGALLTIEPDMPAFAHRSQVGGGDLLLALASGTAGALAFTTGLPSALIGVMVAVALMPPLVAFGMLLGGGYPAASLGPLLLLATNVICLNLAGVATFVAKGVRPRTWWEAERARTAVRRAGITWGALLLALIVMLWLYGGTLL
jgi:uncharacterized hydrophobic protein (TIGR00341 family)